MPVAEFADTLSFLLKHFGSALTEPDLRRATKECRDDIYNDQITHRGRIDSPFFNFIVADGLAIFTFFETDFSVYLVRCNEAELISQTERFAMIDTLECKSYLASQHQKLQPDLVVTRNVCEQWSDGG